MMLSDQAEEEIVVVESVYCLEDEFQRLDEKTYRVKISKNCCVTVQVDPTYPLGDLGISVTAGDLSRHKSDSFANDLKAYNLSQGASEGRQLMLLDFAKEKYASYLSKDEQPDFVEEPVELIIVKIDHMRSSDSYVKTLEKWTSLFDLTGLLTFSKDKGIILLLEGSKQNISKFMYNWKTVNIDVDSRGRPCKEKMMQILYRKEQSNHYLESMKEKNFTCVKTDSLIGYFESTKIYEILKNVL